MNFPIEWHEQCLMNTEESLRRALLDVERTKARVTELESRRNSTPVRSQRPNVAGRLVSTGIASWCAGCPRTKDRPHDHRTTEGPRGAD